MRRALLLLSLLLFAFACSDDDGAQLPSYVTTLGELQTDATGRPSTFIPDGSQPRTVISSHKALTPDSLYRVLAMTLYEDGDKVSLRQMANVLSPKPRNITEDKRKYDPVDLLSLWSSGRYINMRLALRTATEPHAFAFAEEGFDELADGKRLLHLHLYHDRGENPEYYTREAYISCPVYHYADPERPAERSLRQGRDSIVFTVTTYQGDRTLRLLYGD